MFKLKKRIAIVTGASQGIGEVISRHLAHAGAHVICVARTEEKIKKISNSILEKGGSSSYFTCDVSQPNSVRELIENSLKKFNTIDILVNNAGITKDSLLMRMNEKNWDIVLDTNLKGIFYCIKSTIRSMMKNKFGRIINISSIVGITGNAGQSNYAASKAGLIGMSKSIAKEVATRNITVNCIAPGWIKSEMTDGLSEDIKKNFLDRIPMKKIGKPEDIANTVIFLASKEAEYITGQTITVDGGRTIN
ncbi:MAG: 3-oxoacyl-[acyl-carrier-protein] reductase [Candidatus Neomarinimicrobiota bacterium]|tara:strand:- start:15 stop:761 length:747 start_codon:yes stop_codon:yes gene_type:complete